MIEPEHPSTNDLAAFAGGFLPEPEAELIGRHLETCAQCENEIQDLPADGFLLQLRQLVRSASPAALAGAEDDCTPRPAHLLDTASWPLHGRDDESAPSVPAQRGVPPQAPGPNFFGRYRVEQAIASGGFGRVYLARDSELHRPVAIKVPRQSRLATPEAIESFLEEGRILARLDHPHIVPVYDVGRLDDGACYLVSKFIEGESLAQRLKRGRPSVEETARWMAAVAEALHAAHKQRLVHRDIKPGNILLDPADHPYVTDFGLAVDEQHQRDRVGEVSGTPAYMSPEQVRGQAHHLDGRTDIWSVGVVLYECLSGRRPFAADDYAAVFDEILHRPARPPRQIEERIPADLERICLKCLAKDPQERYTTAADLSRDLRRWLPKQQPFFQRAPLLRRVGPWGCMISLTLTGAGILLLSVWGLLGTPTSSVSPPETQDAQLDKAVEQLNKAVEQFNTQRQEQIEHIRKAVEQLNTQRQTRPVGGSRPIPKQDHNPVKPGGRIALPRGFAKLEKQINDTHAAGKEDQEFNLLLKATNDLVEAGHCSIAETLARRMVDLAGNDPGHKPFAYGQLALAQYRGGRVEQAIPNFYESIKTYRVLYDKMQKMPENAKTQQVSSHLARLIGLTLLRIGNARKAMHAYQAAHEAYEEARQLLEKHKRVGELITLLLSYGSLESSRGNHTQGIEMLQRGLDLARQQGDPNAQAEYLVNLGNAYSRAGDHPKSLGCYEKADALVNANASYELKTGLLSNWSTGLVEAGRMTEARQKIAQLRAMIRPGDEQTERILQMLEGLETTGQEKSK